MNRKDMPIGPAPRLSGLKSIGVQGFGASLFLGWRLQLI